MAELLLQMAEVERRVEVSRQLLAENGNYDPSSAFCALEKRGNSQISQVDINSLLKKAGCELTRKELNMLWDFMDKNEDGAVDWSEFFMQFSCQDIQYHELSPSYQNYSLSSKIQLQMARVLEEEIHGLLELERCKSKLYTFPNYKLEHLFDTIDQDRKGYLTVEDVEDFLTDLVPDRVKIGERRIGSKTSKASRILRRLDRN